MTALTATLEETMSYYTRTTVTIEGLGRFCFTAAAVDHIIAEHLPSSKSELRAVVADAAYEGNVAHVALVDTLYELLAILADFETGRLIDTSL